MRISDLIELGRKSIEMFDSYITEKKIKPPMRAYVRHFITELEISETACRSTGSAEIIEKPDWSMTIFNFVNERIKPLNEFKQLNQTIAKKYKQNITKLTHFEQCDGIIQSAFWLESFISRVLYEKLEGTLSSESLIEYASSFKSELDLSPTEYKYVHYLDGIFLENDAIRINDNITIRKTQKSDLEYTSDLFFRSSRPQFMGIPSSILEIELSAKDEKECYQYADRIFNSLRLYHLGSIYSKEVISTKKTVIWPMASSRGWGHTNYFTFRKYTVKKTETKNFIDFINFIEQKLNFNKDEKGYRNLAISLDRYNSALLEIVDIDRKLMTSVMGLEALFSFERDRGNTFKLGIRVAKLVGCLGFDAEDAKKLIDVAYGFRNKVVHGSYISQEDKKRIAEILPQILNYLRISLIVFLLNQGTGKDKMVELIDKALVNDSQNKQFKNLVQKNIKEFRKVFTINLEN